MNHMQCGRASGGLCVACRGCQATAWANDYHSHNCGGVFTSL